MNIQFLRSLCNIFTILLMRFHDCAPRLLFWLFCSNLTWKSCVFVDVSGSAYSVNFRSVCLLILSNFFVYFVLIFFIRDL